MVLSIRSSFLFALLAAGCASPKLPGNNRDTMTQRQKDSVLGQTGIPGASVIGKAQKVADSLNAQTVRTNAVGADTTNRR